MHISCRCLTPRNYSPSKCPSDIYIWTASTTPECYPLSPVQMTVQHTCSSPALGLFFDFPRGDHAIVDNSHHLHSPRHKNTLPSPDAVLTCVFFFISI